MQTLHSGPGTLRKDAPGEITYDVRCKKDQLISLYSNTKLEFTLLVSFKGDLCTSGPRCEVTKIACDLIKKGMAWNDTLVAKGRKLYPVTLYSPSEDTTQFKYSFRLAPELGTGISIKDAKLSDLKLSISFLGSGSGYEEGDLIFDIRETDILKVDFTTVERPVVDVWVILLTTLLLWCLFMYFS